MFPKTNSLLDGRRQPLADMNEFALKIKVGHNALKLNFIFQKLCGNTYGVKLYRHARILKWTRTLSWLLVWKH